MNANELNELLKSGKSCLLLNVLPEEIHAARHIAGSSNACVYETAFLDKVAELAPAKDLPIIVYGAGGGSLDSTAALGKLLAAGYTQVTDVAEGLAGWEAAGLPFDGDGHFPAALALDGAYVLDPAESVIRWTGRNLFNHHSGTVRLTSGEIRLKSGVLKSARFVIDMNSIACEDLADSQWNAMLIRHLRDADFFEIDRFPAAEFIAERAEAIAASSEGTPNFVLKGRFTLRGVTKPLELPVVIASAHGKRVTGQGQLELDRTEFGSIYGSGKFFRYLGKHVVNDHVHLHLKIHADLRLLGFPAYTAERAARRFSRHDLETAAELAAVHHDQSAYVAIVRERVAALESLFRTDPIHPDGLDDHAWDRMPHHRGDSIPERER